METYKKHHPLASDMQKNHAILEELKSQNETTSASLKELATTALGIAQERAALDIELRQLSSEKEELKKRLRCITLRETECDARLEISQVGAELLKASSLLVDACDVVDNELIGNLVQKATKRLKDTLAIP
jgi:predicted nuclease with TOPRIM domain